MFRRFQSLVGFSFDIFLLLPFLFPFLCAVLLSFPLSPLPPCHHYQHWLSARVFVAHSVNHKSSTKRFWIRYLNNFIVTDNNEFKLFFILQSLSLHLSPSPRVFLFCTQTLTESEGTVNCYRCCTVTGKCKCLFFAKKIRPPLSFTLYLCFSLFLLLSSIHTLVLNVV